MTKLFISYRRSDSSQVTGRIYDRLIAEYGSNNVFKDVNSIPLGVDFRESLDHWVGQCDIFFVVIGPEWLEIKSDENKRRLDQATDFVRIEVEAALQRNIPVIPLLIEDAELPSNNDLPTSINQLAFRNAISIGSDPNFHPSIDRLIEGVNEISKTKAASNLSDKGITKISDVPFDKKLQNPKPDNKNFKKWRWLLLGLLPIGALGLIAANIVLANKPLELPNNLTLKLIPAGSFWMGNANYKSAEEPVRKVTINYPFWMSSTEITFQQFDAYLKKQRENIPSDKIDGKSAGRGKRPVVNVKWEEARNYTKWLTKNNKHQLLCRLPSEAEWEYAARADSTTKYHWGDEIGDTNAHCTGCGNKWDNEITAPVASFEPNSFGLYDMHGNVWEWVEDNWHANHEGAHGDARVREGGDLNNRTIRGGSFSSPKDSLRYSNRSIANPNNPLSSLGFRVVCTKR